MENSKPLKTSLQKSPEHRPETAPKPRNFAEFPCVFLPAVFSPPEKIGSKKKSRSTKKQNKTKNRKPENRPEHCCPEKRHEKMIKKNRKKRHLAVSLHPLRLRGVVGKGVLRIFLRQCFTPRSFLYPSFFRDFTPLFFCFRFSHGCSFVFFVSFVLLVFFYCT